MPSSEISSPSPFALSCSAEHSLIGVIGGSGLCKLESLQVHNELEIPTQYGHPSGKIQVGEYAGRDIAFIPRHGAKHTIPPHRVPYKANLAALKSIGVRHVIGTCIAGSLKEDIPPGTFVIPDQFLNFTWGRDDAFDEDGTFIHLPMATPYCSSLSRCANVALSDMGLAHKGTGTVVVIQGPRFSTIAESRMFAALGGDIVNMTQYPECYFAREMGMCYCVIASVTDYDVGVVSDTSFGRSTKNILAIFQSNVAKTHEILARMLQDPNVQSCSCAQTDVHTYYEQAL